MKPASHEAGGVQALSLRAMDRAVAYAALYEYEDVLSECTGAAILAPAERSSLERRRRLHKLLRAARLPRHLAAAAAAGSRLVGVDGARLLLVTVHNPWGAGAGMALGPARRWRREVDLAAIWITEAWAHHLPGDYLFELLAPFDHVFVGLAHAVDAIAARCGRPCSYLPMACDVLRFAPAEPLDEARRVFDVVNIGRRSPVVHAALREAMRRRTITYYYDTVAADGPSRSFAVDDPAEHRELIAAVLRHGRFLVANRARFNDPAYTGERSEISARCYEGIAAGCVLLGEPPQAPWFAEQFDWPDAIVPMPIDCPDPLAVIRALDADPARIAAARCANVRNAALRHDWLHRIERMFSVLGLDTTAAMRLRRERLEALAACHAGRARTAR